MEDNKVSFFKTHTPTLEELAKVLQQGLTNYFGDVQIELVDCPDFTKKPYELAFKGLHGSTTIADVGGVHNLIPHVNLESHYDLATVVKSIYKSDSDYPLAIHGPGGGAFGSKGYCCEFMGSAAYDKQGTDVNLTDCKCRYAYVNENGEGRWEEQVSDDRFGLMGNFFMSQARVGKVLKVNVKRRTNKANFTESIRAVLLDHYKTDKPVSMGGVFLINKGVAKLHIMPKHWPKQPCTTDSVNNEWLRYYEIKKHPLVCLSVFHSHDPGFDLRLEHTHCYNLDTTDEAGHYHYDMTPETVEYEGYFNVAERVFRLDGGSGGQL